MSPPGAAPAGARTGPRGAAVVAALAVTQTVGYGTLHYAFAVLLVPVAADLGAGTTAVTGAYTAGVLAGAAVAVPVGRWLDRHGGRALMTAGSGAGAALLAAWSQVGSLPQLYLVQLGIGVAAAASLYEAAFAVVVGLTGADRRARAILAVTVVAGFAGPVFLPLTGRLVDAHGWRTALLVLAAVQAATVPLHALAVRRPDRRPGPAALPAPPRAVRTDRAFRLLALGFTAHTAATGAVAVHLVAALVAWGHPPAFAATVAGLLGVLSVAGRLVTTALGRRGRTAAVTAAVFAGQAVAAALLPVAGTTTGGAIAAVAGFGLGFGVATVARPVLLAERYDPRHYATLAGLLVVPVTLARAAGPLAAAALTDATGHHLPMFAAVAALCAVAAAALAAAREAS